MESASKLAKKQRVVKPVSSRVQSKAQEQEKPVASRQPEAGRSIDALPSGPGTRAMRQAAVIQMQQTHGNGHVMRQLDVAIQRQDDEGAAAGSGGPSSISGSGGSVETGGGGVEITGGTVKVHSGFTEVDGVLKAGTLIADSVISSSYSPGAGNIW